MKISRNGEINERSFSNPNPSIASGNGLAAWRWPGYVFK